MEKVEILRCETCTGQCDEHYKRTAIATIVPVEFVRPDNKDNDLINRLRQPPGNCELTPEQIICNLVGIRDGRLNLNGR